MEDCNMKKVLFMALCATFVAVSCEKIIEIQEEEVNNQEQIVPEVKTQTRTFSLALDPEVATKLSIDGGTTSWTIGDKILVHGEYINKSGYSVVVELDGVTNTISPDGQTAYITITTSESVVDGCVKPYSRADYTSSLYAIYPAEAVTDQSGHHSYYNNQFKTTNAPLMVAYDDGAGKFVFRNLCSMITFVMPDLDGDPLTNDFDYYIFSGKNNEYVAYDSYAAVFAKYSDSAVKNRQGGSYDSSKTQGPKTSITGPVTCDGTTIHRIFIPGLTNGDSPSLGVTFSNGFVIEFVKDGDVVKKVSTSKSLTLAVGEYLPLGDISSHLKTYSRPAHASALASSDDLSVPKPANCYVVRADVAANENKVFKFRQYKGNDTVTPFGRVYDVELLWETFNNTTKPNVHDVIADIDYDSDYIYFKMPSTLSAGNAVIAAKNVLGEIIWSWHIWVPSNEITSSTYGGVSKTAMMDRNLGALVIAEGDADTDIDVESCGLFYQWGRKDPFPGPGALLGDYNSSIAAVAGTIGTRGQTSYTEIHKYPNYFIATGSPETDASKDWTSPHSSSLWGSSKGVNDPCPPGWKLPSFSSGSGDIWDSSVGSVESITALVGASYTKNTTHHWLKLGVAYDDLNPTTTGFVYFPYVGYRTQDGDAYAYAGQRILLWQAKGGSGSYASILYAASDLQYKETERKARGGNVRCVAE